MSDPIAGRAPTYVGGLDHVLGGGIPKGRTTLVAGGPGSGKTMLAMEFVAGGAANDEPGVFIGFEQTREELLSDFASLDNDIAGLVDAGRLAIRHIEIDGRAIAETGEYGLDALLIRIGQALDSVGARRVALDTLEVLFTHLRDTVTLRGEIRRIFRWLRDRGVTALVTAEAGDGSFTRHGLEEYVSDCVILLDHRIRDEISTRRARVLKYRGGAHSDDEHPFLIDRDGFTLMPVTSTRLGHPASKERVSTGVPGLDDMIEGGGYYRGASVLVSGTAGTGKSSMAASFLDAACRRGERALYLAFEESEDQIVRNMGSIGLDLRRWIDEGLLHVRARRPSHHGLEQHLAEVDALMDELEPQAVAVDPFTNLITIGTEASTRSMLTRLVDSLKGRGVTTLYTSLGRLDESGEGFRGGISSLMDTWIALDRVDRDGESLRTLHIIKSRGMRHSHEVHALTLTETGLGVGAARSGAGAGS